MALAVHELISRLPAGLVWWDIQEVNPQYEQRADYPFKKHVVKPATATTTTYVTEFGTGTGSGGAGARFEGRGGYREPKFTVNGILGDVLTAFDPITEDYTHDMKVRACAILREKLVAFAASTQVGHLFGAAKVHRILNTLMQGPPSAAGGDYTGMCELLSFVLDAPIRMGKPTEQGDTGNAGVVVKWAGYEDSSGTENGTAAIEVRPKLERSKK